MGFGVAHFCSELLLLKGQIVEAGVRLAAIMLHTANMKGKGKGFSQPNSHRGSGGEGVEIHCILGTRI